MSGIIHLDKIEKQYYMGGQGIPILKGLSLDIYKNEYVALMGPSGSGKSTLMNILGCLDTPTGGTYILNDQDVSKMADDQLADIRNVEIGFVFQQFNLLPRLTAAENVALPLIYAGVSKEERMARAVAALEKVGLGDRSHHKSNEMSGGQIQRVAIARAIINNPAILLADEPTGKLDTNTAREIFTLFREIVEKEGATILMAAHDPLVDEYVEEVLQLSDGQIMGRE